MPVLQLLSDEHLEFLKGDARVEYFKRLDPEGVDVLILAGDICLGTQLWSVLPEFCRRYPKVVFVPGNHEFYGVYPGWVYEVLQEQAAKNANLVLFNGEIQEVAGLKMLGATLWYPSPKPDIRDLGVRYLADYDQIFDFEPWVYEQHARDLTALEKGAKDADVVITHYIPTRRCIAPRFREGLSGVLNYFFCYDLTERIEEWQPKLWCFGHTHDRMTTHIGKTIVTANPRGYPTEREEPERGRHLQRCLIEVNAEGAHFLNGEPGPRLASERREATKKGRV